MSGEIRVQEGSPEGPARPGEWKARQDTSGGAGLPAHALTDAAKQAKRIPSVGPAWRLEGPTNVGGRITSLAVDPTQPDTVYAAAASGGVWKSTDRATTFSSVWPHDYPQAIGAIAAAPDGTIYAGTGESNPGGGSITYEGDGIYKSTNGGRTWTNLGLRDSSTISLIQLDPADPSRIFVAVTGSLFRPGGERGIYRSLNGGRTWRRVLAGTTSTTGGNVVAIDPANPNRVWATLWDRQRLPDLRRYGGTGSGVYRSADGGDTWTRLENVVTPTPGDDIGLRPDPRLGRIGLAIAPGNRVYVLTSTYTAFGDQKGFYVSDDGGDTFDTRTLPGGGAPYWWFGHVWVDPADPLHLFVPAVQLRESTDGGTTWTTNAGMQADNHAIAWDPKVPGRVYEGNDGGAYRSDTNGSSRSWVKATYEPYTQFYSVAVSAQDATRIAGGTQDNGSLRTWGGVRWNSYGGGDGEQNLINPVDQETVYNCSQFGACRRSLDGGTTFTGLQGAESDRWNWFSPLEFAPDDPRVVYFGGNRLNRSTDGLTFTPISPDLSGGPGQDPAYPFGTLTTVWSAKSQPSRILAGTDDGRLWRTDDTGATWQLLLTGRPWVTRVKIDDRRPSQAYVTLSGYRAGTGDGHVLWTVDAGRSWRDITGNLPNTPVNDVVIGPYGLLFIATDVGVFAGPPAGRFWLRIGRDLPLASVTDLEYHAGTGRLFAATFGRGVYSLPLTSQLTATLRTAAGAH
ncbi:beta propeller repeat protein [Flindersiella endophytica]